MSTNNSRMSQGGKNQGGKNSKKILRKSLNLNLDKTLVKKNKSNDNNKVKKEDKKENTNQIAPTKIEEVKEEDNPYDGAFEECSDQEDQSEQNKNNLSPDLNTNTGKKSNQI